MGNIVDLDVLVPEDEIVKFKSKDGREFTVRLFIPAAVGFTIIDNLDALQRIFPGGPSARPRMTRESIELALRIVADVLHEQHSEIDVEWVKANISLPRLAVLVFKLSLPVYQFLIGSGFLEAAQPVKEPETSTSAE